MKLGYTLAQGRGATNLLLTQLADRLTEKGLRLCGTVQSDTECADNGRCDMDVRILPAGPVIRISQSLGPEARGCRLDPAALEQAVRMTEETLANGADLLIVNKFGKHEADGRGFRSTIAAALELGIPVIVGANGMNLDALKTFAGDDIEELPATLDALETWATAG